MKKGQNLATWDAGRRFYKDEQGTLFFHDAPRLCVPVSERGTLLAEVHESPFESAHAGPAKLWQILSGKFYWRRMKTDVFRFCGTRDVCQKIKNINFKKFGRLIPNLISRRPYASISLDLVSGLPMMDDGYNTILVVVDRLTKHAQFILTDTGLSEDMSPQTRLLYEEDAKASTEELQMHSESARNAIARAQVRQSEIYNKGRKEIDLEGDSVLVDPHSLE